MKRFFILILILSGCGPIDTISGGGNVTGEAKRAPAIIIPAPEPPETLHYYYDPGCQGEVSVQGHCIGTIEQYCEYLNERFDPACANRESAEERARCVGLRNIRDTECVIAI